MKRFLAIMGLVLAGTLTLTPVLPAVAAPPAPQIATSATLDTVGIACTAVVRATWSGVRSDYITAHVVIRSSTTVGTEARVDIPITKQRAKLTLTFTGTTTTLDSDVWVEAWLEGYQYVTPSAPKIEIDSQCVDWQRAL